MLLHAAKDCSPWHLFPSKIHRNVLSVSIEIQELDLVLTGNGESNTTYCEKHLVPESPVNGVCAISHPYYSRSSSTFGR